jgi:hypothetical protein
MLIRIVLCLSAGVGIGELYGGAVRPARSASAEASAAAPQRAGGGQCHAETAGGSMIKTQAGGANGRDIPFSA